MIIVETKRMVIDLERRGLVPVRDAVGTRIDCLRGRIWITEHGSKDDHVLDAGEWYVISRGGLVAVQALSEALVELRAPAVRPTAGWLTSWVERLWTKWAARAASGQPAIARPRAG